MLAMTHHPTSHTSVFMPFSRAVCAIFFLTLSVLLTGIAHAAAPVCEKTVRWNNDPPYSLRDAQGKVTGFYIDLIQNVLAKMDCSMNLVEMPWARALSELEAGRLDILPGALKTAERQRFALFSDPVNTSPNVLFMKKTAVAKFNLKSLDDITRLDFRLGVQMNVAYGSEFDDLMKSPAFLKQLTIVYKRHSGWKMVDIDRIDGLIADEVTGLLELKELDLEKTIGKTSLVVSSRSGLIAFSKKTIDINFVEDFNRHLQSMISNGDFAKIHAKHIPCKLSLRTLACQ